MKKLIVGSLVFLMAAQMAACSGNNFEASRNEINETSNTVEGVAEQEQVEAASGEEFSAFRRTDRAEFWSADEKSFDLPAYCENNGIKLTVDNYLAYHFEFRTRSDYFIKTGTLPTDSSCILVVDRGKMTYSFHIAANKALGQALISLNRGGVMGSGDALEQIKNYRSENPINLQIRNKEISTLKNDGTLEHTMVETSLEDQASLYMDSNILKQLIDVLEAVQDERENLELVLPYGFFFMSEIGKIETRDGEDIFGPIRTEFYYIE